MDKKEEKQPSCIEEEETSREEDRAPTIHVSLDEEAKFFNKNLIKFRRRMPEYARAYFDFWRQTKEKSNLKVETKELIALAITVAIRCKPCIRLHTKICFDLGIKECNILEAAGIGAAMGGGPSYQYLAYLMEALVELKSKKKKGGKNGRI